MIRNFTRLGLTALALVAGPGLYAQDTTTGAVFGSVKNNKGVALTNARIFLDGGRGNVEYRADANGQFRATGLIPGKYSLVVTADGFEGMRKQTITVGLGMKTPVNVVLSTVAAVTVEVVAAANQLDASTVTTGAQFASETFAALPLGRSFTAIASMAPGVVSSGVDESNPSIGGGSGLENQYVIDGANTTNSGFGSAGSYSGAYGSMGTGINSDFIQEVQVKSFAMEAEFGQTTGGIINAITKSGSNTFEGSVFSYFDFDGLQAKNRTVKLEGIDSPIFESQTRMELGFTASGPIIKDKLFYFVGYNPIQGNLKRKAPTSTNDTPYDLTGNVYEQKSVTNSYYAKAQWQINPDQLLEFSTFGDPGERKQGPQAAADYRGTEAKFSTLKFGSQTFTLKYNGVFFNDFMVEGRISKVSNTFERQITAAGNSEWQVADTGNANRALSLNAAGFYEIKNESGNTQYDLKLAKSFGIVDLKFGYLHEDVTFDSANQRSGPLGFSDPHKAGTVFTTGLSIQKRYKVDTPSTLADPDAAAAANIAAATPYYRIIRGNTSPIAIKTKTKYDAIFLQGNFKLGNVNLKAGIRAEEQTISGTDLSYKFKGSDNISPRLGLTWDVEGTGKSKVYAFYGRYFEKVPNDIAVRALSTEQGVNKSDFRTLTGFTGLSDPIMDSENINDIALSTGTITVHGPGGTTASNRKHFLTTGSAPTEILPGTKSMYQDEMVLGYDMETSFGMTFSNRVIYREMGRILEDLSLDGDSYFIGNPGQNENTIRTLPSIIGTDAETAAATFPAPSRKYWALEVEARKATSTYSAFMNLRFSKLEGNYEGLFRGDNGQDDPNISSLYDLPVEAMADAERGLEGREQFMPGPLPSDRTLVVNLGYSYAFGNGFSAGALSRIQTGQPLTSYVAHPAYGNAGEIPRWGRGTDGRTPTTYLFDGTASYVMKLAGKKSLTFRADVFNVFNQQKALTYDTNMDVGVGSPNPNYMAPLTYDTGRRVRLGVRFGF